MKENRYIMKKLLNGIAEFRQKSLAEYRKKFANLANRASADVLFVACCDSRVVPNTFASTDPGDLFVLRNVGNFVSPFQADEHAPHDESAIAAIEFSIKALHVKDIVVCGHSECAAIKAIVDGRESLASPHLQAWLRYGEPAYQRFQSGFRLNQDLSIYNEVSQINALQQIEHLKTYPIVQQALRDNAINLHAWWFELETANVYQYREADRAFSLIGDEA